MAGKNGDVSSVLRHVCGPGDVAGGVSQTFLQVCKAVFAKNKEWYSGSSSSSGGEKRWLCGQDEELKKLRAQVELRSKQQGVWPD